MQILSKYQWYLSRNLTNSSKICIKTQKNFYQDKDTKIDNQGILRENKTKYKRIWRLHPYDFLQQIHNSQNLSNL